MFDKYTRYAKWYEILLTKMFWKKLVTKDWDITITSYFYKWSQYIQKIIK